MLTNAKLSIGKEERELLGKGKSLKESQTSRENGSKMLFLQPPKRLGINNIFVIAKIGNSRNEIATCDCLLYVYLSLPMLVQHQHLILIAHTTFFLLPHPLPFSQ